MKKKVLLKGCIVGGFDREQVLRHIENMRESHNDEREGYIRKIEELTVKLSDREHLLDLMEERGNVAKDDLHREQLRCNELSEMVDNLTSEVRNVRLENFEKQREQENVARLVKDNLSLSLQLSEARSELSDTHIILGKVMNILAGRITEIDETLIIDS